MMSSADDTTAYCISISASSLTLIIVLQCPAVLQVLKSDANIAMKQPIQYNRNENTLLYLYAANTLVTTAPAENRNHAR